MKHQRLWTGLWIAYIHRGMGRKCSVSSLFPSPWHTSCSERWWDCWAAGDGITVWLNSSFIHGIRAGSSSYKEGKRQIKCLSSTSYKNETENESCVWLFVTPPMDCSLLDSSVHGILQARILEWVAISFFRGLPNPWIKPRSPALQEDSLLSEPPGKLKNAEVGSWSLLQGIFLIQESNWGLLNCRKILYQLRYRGIPMI